MSVINRKTCDTSQFSFKSNFVHFNMNISDPKRADADARGFLHHQHIARPVQLELLIMRLLLLLSPRKTFFIEELHTRDPLSVKDIILHNARFLIDKCFKFQLSPWLCICHRERRHQSINFTGRSHLKLLYMSV